MAKAEWVSILDDVPEHVRSSYKLYDALVDIDGNWIATIEQFKSSAWCFYANTGAERSGCLRSYEWARQWCETKTKNKIN